MKWTIGKKLFLGFGVILALLVVFSVYVVTQMVEIKANMDQYRVHENMLKESHEMLLHITQVWQYTTDASLTKNKKTFDAEAKQNYNDARQDIEALIKQNPNDAALVQKLLAIGASLDKFWSAGDKMVAGYFVSSEKGDAVMVDFDAIASSVLAQTEAVETDIKKEADAYYASMVADAKDAMAFTIVFVLITLGLSIAVVLIITPQITKPLAKLTAVSETVAGGNLTADVPIDNRSDEIGILAKSFGVMVANLRNITASIHEGVNTLASSASQILTATKQLASGSVETATATSQTATSIEEIKQTANVSTQKAKYVSETAQKTAQISHDGKKSVEDTVAAMTQIQTQMNSITQSILRLSEQSRTIGEIIVAVNSIADQSNLLAVNAAIEAAKAGEQGKGFAVVAQEIKYLAEQSKQSTAQVRVILDEIQKAITSVATTAEKGSKIVEVSANQSNQTNEVIAKLSESIAESAQAAVQIAASSQQQLVGLDQVAVAMENIKVAAEQSAASTRQVEGGAQMLYDLGQKLKGLAGQFKV